MYKWTFPYAKGVTKETCANCVNNITIGHDTTFVKLYDYEQSHIYTYYEAHGADLTTRMDVIIDIAKHCPGDAYLPAYEPIDFSIKRGCYNVVFCDGCVFVNSQCFTYLRLTSHGEPRDASPWHTIIPYVAKNGDAGDIEILWNGTYGSVPPS